MRLTRAGWSIELLAQVAVALVAGCTYDPGAMPKNAAEAGADAVDATAAPLDQRPPEPGRDAAAEPDRNDAPPEPGRDDAAGIPTADTAPSEQVPDAPPLAPDAPPDAVPDATPDAPPCPRPPATIFNATPANTCGVVCNASRALTSDGMSAGLECTGGGTVLIDGKPVTACIGADFGATMNLNPLVVRVAATANACGTPCTTLCETGRSALVFHGQTRGVYRFAAEIAVAKDLADYRFTLDAGSRYVLICRGGSGPHRDDIVVDSIASLAACP